MSDVNDEHLLETILKRIDDAECLDPDVQTGETINGRTEFLKAPCGTCWMCLQKRDAARLRAWVMRGPRLSFSLGSE